MSAQSAGDFVLREYVRRRTPDGFDLPSRSRNRTVTAMLSGPTRLVLIGGMLLLPSCAGSEPQAGPTITPTILATEETPSPQETHTGEVWEGTIDSAVTIVGPAAGHNPCGDPHYVRGTARIVVAEDGSATGTYDVTGCNVSQPHAEFTGTATSDGFLFPQLIVFTNGERITKVSPTEAKATLTNCQCVGGAGARWATTWDLSCKTC